MLSDEDLINWFKNLSLLNKQILYTWSHFVLFDKQNEQDDGGEKDE